LTQLPCLITDSRKEITENKNRITALQLFSTEGYYNTSIRQIASQANIALGLLYSHYSGKEALLRELFQDGIAMIRTEFLHESKGKSLEEQILLAYENLRERRVYWRLLHSVRMQKALSDYLAQEIEDINLFFIEHCRTELKNLKIKGPRTEARIIWSGINGVFAKQQMRVKMPGRKKN